MLLPASLRLYVIYDLVCVMYREHVFKGAVSMQKQAYLNEIEARLRRLFSASRDGYRVADAERHRLEGFIQAGVFLRITTNDEVSKVMESIHFSVFGQSISGRKAEKMIIWPETVIDYSQYEQPAFVRKD